MQFSEGEPTFDSLESIILSLMAEQSLQRLCQIDSGPHFDRNSDGFEKYSLFRVNKRCGYAMQKGIPL